MALVSKNRKLLHPSSHFPILLYIPPEVLSIVFYSGGLSSADLLNLSLVNRAHRSLLIPYIFRRLTIPWHKLSFFLQTYRLSEAATEVHGPEDKKNALKKSEDHIQSRESLGQINMRKACGEIEFGAHSPIFLSLSILQKTTTSLEISQPNSALEWKLNKEVDAIVSDYLPHLQHLKIYFTSGSFPLKYLKFKNKKSLRSFTISTSRPGSIFNLDHLAQLLHIETLVLQNFKLASPSHFQVPVSKFIRINTGIVNKAVDIGLQDTKCSPRVASQRSNIALLTNLKIIDCSWDFPTKLNDFDYSNENIKSIHLTFTNNNNFILSERFKFLLLNPMISKNLQEFELNLQDNTQLIKHANIESYLNFETLNTLKTVKLIGMPFVSKTRFN